MVTFQNLFCVAIRHLPYMAGVIWKTGVWRDRVSSLEVAGRCGVRELGAMLSEREEAGDWGGLGMPHVVRRDEVEILEKTQLIEVLGCWPPGRTRMTWRKKMQLELASQNLQEEQALNKDQ